MVDRRDAAPWVWVLAGISAPATLVAAWLVAGESQTDIRLVALAAGVLALAASITIPTRWGSSRTVAHGVGAAIPLILIDRVPMFDARGAIAAGLAGMGLAWFVASVRGKDQRQLIPVMMQSLGSYLVYVILVSVVGMIPPFDDLIGWWRTVLFLVSAGGAFVFELLWASVVAVGRDRGGVRYRLVRGLGDADSYFAITGAGALFGLTVDYVGWWALVVSVLPYSFTHTALARFRSTKTTYEQTLRALAQIPEVAGHALPGHALSAARLGRQLALDLRLLPREVDSVEHSALMHEVGLVALNEAGIIQSGYTDSDIARWGSEVLGESIHLASVAENIRRQYDPHRLPGGPEDDTLGKGARIVRVVGAFVRSTEGGRSAAETLDDLQRGTSDDYDPAVVSALRDRLERVGGLRHPAGRRRSVRSGGRTTL